MALSFKDDQILNKIISEIEFLQKYTKPLSLGLILDDEEKKRTIAMTLLNIGELASNLSKEFKKSNDAIPFREIIGMRNHAAHGYFALHFERIWETIQEDIPELKSKIIQLLT